MTDKAKQPRTPKPRLKTIPIAAIKVENRARKHFGTTDDKTGLRESIEDFGGVLQPITVEDLGDGSYRLLAGERRLRTATELNHVTIDAKIFPELDETKRLEAEFGENFYRLNWSIEERLELTKRIDEAYKRKHGEATRGPGSTGWTTQQTAEVMGRSKTRVSRDLTAAKYLEIAPELAKEGSTDKIIRAGKKLVQKFEKTQHAQAIETRKADTDRDIRVKRLCESFILVDHHEDLLKSGAAGAITELESESIDLINFDPPYGIDHGNNRKLDADADEIQTYNEIPHEQYPQWISHMLKHCYRVLKPNSWLLLWFAPHPWTAYKTTHKIKVGNKTLERTFFVNLVIQWLYDAGFDQIRALPGQWFKTNGQTMQPDLYLANDVEMFYYVGKGRPKLYRSGNATFTYRKVPLTKRWHLIQRPIPLMFNIFNVFCKPGSLILSPCLGSGVDILGADDHNCRLWGWDVEREYRDGFVNFVDKNFQEKTRWSNLDYEEWK